MTPMFELGVVEAAQGSCRFNSGGTVVLATAEGPMHDSERAASQDPARGGLEGRVSLGNRGGSDRVVVERRLEEELTAVLRNAVDLDAFPRELARVAVLVVVDGGAAAIAALNAAVLALLDARLPLASVPLAVDATAAAAAARDDADADGAAPPPPTTFTVAMDATSDDSAFLSLDTAGEPFDAAALASAVANARVRVDALRTAALAAS